MNPKSIQLQQRVAVLISSPPKNASDKLEYYHCICVQLATAISIAMQSEDWVRLSNPIALTYTPLSFIAPTFVIRCY